MHPNDISWIRDDYGILLHRDAIIHIFLLISSHAPLFRSLARTSYVQ